MLHIAVKLTGCRIAQFGASAKKVINAFAGCDPEPSPALAYYDYRSFPLPPGRCRLTPEKTLSKHSYFWLISIKITDFSRLERSIWQFLKSRPLQRRKLYLPPSARVSRKRRQRRLPSSTWRIAETLDIVRNKEGWSNYKWKLFNVNPQHQSYHGF